MARWKPALGLLITLTTLATALLGNARATAQIPVNMDRDHVVNQDQEMKPVSAPAEVHSTENVPTEVLEIKVDPGLVQPSGADSVLQSHGRETLDDLPAAMKSTGDQAVAQPFAELRLVDQAGSPELMNSPSNSGLPNLEMPGSDLVEPQGRVQLTSSEEPSDALEPAAHQLDSQVAPSITVKSTMSPASLLNECVVQVLPGSASQRGFRLQLSVPDSVSDIEVIPAGQSQRQFRIRLDDPRNLDPVTPSEHRPQSDSMTAAQSMTTNPYASSREDALNVDSLRESLKSIPAGPGFKDNPFFNQQAYARRQSEAMGAVELTDAQVPVDETMQPASLQGATVLSTMDTQVGDPQQVMSPEIIKASTLKGANGSLPVSVEPLGPATMDPRGTADFSVVLRNLSDAPVAPFDLRLSLPEGMHITILDRPADYNAEYQTVAWKLESLGPNETATIRYRVESKLNGRHTQALEIGRGGRFGKLTTFSTSTVR